MKKPKKIKKELKAMTLVEVIIALAIFAIMSSLLAGSVAMVCNLSKKADHVNKKIVREAPAAEIMDKNAAKSEKEVVEGTLRVSVEGAKSTEIVIYDQYKIKDPKNEADLADFRFIVPIVTTAPAVP